VLAKRTFWLAWFIPAALALVATACSSGGSARVERASSHATSTAPSTTADPQAADKAAVLAAYNGYYTSLQEAWGLNGGQPHQNPQLADYASDAALDAAVNSIETMVQHHQTVRGPQPEHHATVRCLQGSTAVVDDDLIDNTNVYEANGRQVATGPGSASESAQQHNIVLLQKRPSDGRWAVFAIGSKEKSCSG